MTAVTAPPAAVDLRSRRWLVAVHEAGHVAAARSFDWRLVFTRLTPDDGGLTRDTPPWLRERRRAARESVLISLAGPLADERLLAVTLPEDGRYGDRATAARDLLRAGIPEGCETDMTTAHREAAVLDEPLGELLGEARALVRSRWPEIERVARVLYVRGALDTAGIREAARR